MPNIHKSSFRDPGGFLFYENGKLLRQVNLTGKKDYDLLLSSGLYDYLTGKGWLIPHKELSEHKGVAGEAYTVIEPEKVDFISYPYEWCFSQMKDAAIATLRIQKAALGYGMWLKDASAYNIQFHQGKPVFVDTLSFESYRENQPWPAYRQFAEHFLAPLALMSYIHPDMNRMLSLHLDGIPLERAVKLLPFRAKCRPSLLMHLHLHARAQQKFKDSTKRVKKSTLSKKRLLHLTESLGQAVGALRLKTRKTTWAGYYGFMNYSDDAFEKKKEIVSAFLKKINPDRVWDLGANTGEFTDLAANMDANCIAFDVDPLAVEVCYRMNKEKKIRNILPLVMDLTNPSPATGWANKERSSFAERELPDTLMALALIHHLAIPHNLPFEKIAAFFSRLGEHLVIEFVPKQDSQVQKLLATRKDVYPHYNETHFEKTFSACYAILEKLPVEGTIRTLYRMKRR